MTIRSNQNINQEFYDQKMPWEGPHTFYRAPMADNAKGADIAVIGMPQSFGHFLYCNQHWAPQAIREQSCCKGMFPSDWPWGCGLMNEYNVVDCGDVSYEPTIKSSFLENATNMVERLARDGASILSLGGDHMSTEPLMKGLHRVYGGGWGLIDIDAHADLIAVDDDALDEHTCGNMFYLALKDGFLDPKKTFQLGLRTEEDLAQDKWARDLGVSQIDVFECEDLGPVKIAEMILEAVGDSKVIMTMDIDGFDPGECGGGQASPHPGGLRFNWVRRMLQAMKGINVVGADFVEIDPVKDMESRTSTNVAVIILNDMAHLMGLARKKRGTKC